MPYSPDKPHESISHTPTPAVSEVAPTVGMDKKPLRLKKAILSGLGILATALGVTWPETTQAAVTGVELNTALNGQRTANVLKEPVADQKSYLDARLSIGTPEIAATNAISPTIKTDVVAMNQTDIVKEGGGGGGETRPFVIGKVSADRLNVRSLPSADGAIINSLVLGNVVSCNELSGDGNWIQCSFEGGEGWVAKKYVNFDGDFATLLANAKAEAAATAAVTDGTVKAEPVAAVEAEAAKANDAASSTSENTAPTESENLPAQGNETITEAEMMDIVQNKAAEVFSIPVSFPLVEVSQQKDNFLEIIGKIKIADEELAKLPTDINPNFEFSLQKVTQSDGTSLIFMSIVSDAFYGNAATEPLYLLPEDYQKNNVDMNFIVKPLACSPEASANCAAAINELFTNLNSGSRLPAPLTSLLIFNVRGLPAGLFVSGQPGITNIKDFSANFQLKIGGSRPLGADVGVGPSADKATAVIVGALHNDDLNNKIQRWLNEIKQNLADAEKAQKVPELLAYVMKKILAGDTHFLLSGAKLLALQGANPANGVDTGLPSMSNLLGSLKTDATVATEFHKVVLEQFALTTFLHNEPPADTFVDGRRISTWSDVQDVSRAYPAGTDPAITNALKITIGGEPVTYLGFWEAMHIPPNAALRAEVVPDSN